MELSCAIKNYAWGKLGLESKVALLALTSLPELDIKENEPYAELWMGVHPSGPSTVKSTGQLLPNWFKDNPDALGPIIHDNFESSLPYLFKVLSVNKALSIQAHPTKEHAAGLHFRHPNLYPDPNHKPEIAIALTPFQAFCGFRPIEEIRTFTKEVPELVKIIGEANVKLLEKADSYTQKQEALKACFTALMTSTDYVQYLKQLIDQPKKEGSLFLSVEALLDRLNNEFPGDRGCLAVFFMNYLTLEPGQALFLAPNEPHAYLYGDCIECMANSDNVVRAGLTPKYIDVDTLCEMLTYSSRSASQNLFQGKSVDSFVTLFAPPISDFSVYEIKINDSTQEYSGPTLESASILITIEGEATLNDIHLKPGSVLLLPYNSSLHFTNINKLLAYVATCLPRKKLGN